MTWLHVVSSAAEWRVEREGTREVLGRFPPDTEGWRRAVRLAREVCARERGEFIVRGEERASAPTGPSRC